MGVDGLGVRHVGGVNIRDLPVDAVRNVRRTADAFGLPIVAVTSPFGRDLYLDDPDGPAVGLLARRFGNPDVLGASLRRGVAPWIPGKDPPPQWAGPPGGRGALPRLTGPSAP